MTFLLILVLATLAMAGVEQIRTGSIAWRRAARHGLGIAFVGAGVSHLVNTTPFEQHLPDWVPAATAIIVGSGLVEIVLGVALVVARRSTSVYGLATAGFLAAVFPANVYVAVADVDVDGLPGGVYPWVRLPLQAVFIAWAWWSTRSAADQVETEGATSFGPMPALPPTTGPAGAWAGATIVQTSVLHLRRLRDVPAFMAAALRLRSAFAEQSGAIEMSLRAAPLRRTFWTLSTWRSEADLQGFVTHPAHVNVMRRFGPAMRSSNFVTWRTTDAVTPTWNEAARRLDADEHRVGQRT